MWETLYNPNFNPLEFEGFRSQAGLNAFTLKHRRDGSYCAPTVYDLVTTPKSELVKIEGITSSRLCTIRDKIKPMRLELEMPVKYIPETRKYIKLSETEKL